MGYHTYFSLDILPEPAPDHLMFDRKIDYHCVTLGQLYEGMDESSWDTYDEEMIQISKDYPEFVFILDGQGDASDDIWRNFYQHGKIYRWQLEYTIPSFDDIQFLMEDYNE